MVRWISLVVWLVALVPCRAATITVDDDGPADFSTIQAALDAAVTGDNIVVADGIYTGPGNRALDFGGKDVTLRSENGPGGCVINCQRQDRALNFDSDEGPSCLVEGFTIINGSASSGAGIRCYQASPTITNCILEGNSASSGGGAIACGYESSPAITRCIIRNNSAYHGGAIKYEYGAKATIVACTIIDNHSDWAGGGIDCDSSCSPTIVNCVLARNSTDGDGGAISTGSSGSLVITNCTISSNSAQDDGGGIFCESSSSSKVTNCLFQGNVNHAIYQNYESAELIVSYCLFANNTAGDCYDAQSSRSQTGENALNALDGFENNLSGYPAFAFEDDFHLTAGSACIDNGTNNPPGLPSLVDIEGRPRIVDGRYSGTAIADIGAYEFDPARPAIALSPIFIEFIREPDGPNPASRTLKIRNPAGGSLRWRIEEQCPWLSASPADGISDGQVAEITLSVDASELSQGFYQCGVSVTDPNALNDPREVVVRLLIKGELLVPQQFATIQGAVNAAMTGETIIVAEGLYEEYVTVDKKLMLLGVGGPTIDPPGTGSMGLRLTADGCTVDGFVLAGAGAGLTVNSSDNAISNNTIVDNGQGVVLGYSSARNTLSNNEIHDNTLRGMSVSDSRGNTLRGNHISGSAVGFKLVGRTLSYYEQDIDVSNTVEGKPIYYLVGATGTVVDSSSNAACVFAVNCSGLTIRDLTLSGNHRGVCLFATDNSRIENVVAADNEETGIWLEQSSHNELIGNTASGSVYGIVLFGSTSNTLTSNACRDNEYNFWCRGAKSDDYLQDIDVSNTVDGKPIYYLVGQADTTVDAATGAGCVYAVNCRNIAVRDLMLGGNGIGVALVGTTESRIERVACADHVEAGILLRECSDISFADCDSSYNETGIVAYGGAGIQIERTRVASNLAGVGFMGTRQVELLNSIIMGNSRSARITSTTTETWGGVLVDGDGDLTVVNCTVYGNASTGYYYSYEIGAGGITCKSSADSLTVLNSIVWANQPQQISAGYSGVSRGGRGVPVPQSTTVAYCDVQGGFDGVGNIDEAPLIVCDGHLQIGSPCIDRGDPNVAILSQEDIDGEARLAGVAVDIGADEYMDRDQDGLPDWWENEFFLDPNAAEPDADPDGDAHDNLDEYRWYASDPTVPCNVLYVDAALGNDANDGYTRESAKKSIQAAIEAAANSDRVLVAPGTYQGGFNLLGRQIIVQSHDPADRDVVASTVVDGAVYLASGELRGCIVDGLTIAGASGSPSRSYVDTGITCSGSSPTLRRCVITELDQSYSYELRGTAISCYYASPAILQCTISGNIAGQQGSVILMDQSDALLQNCLLCGNRADYPQQQGLVIRLSYSKLNVKNCTFAQNAYSQSYAYAGSAISCIASELLIANSILWDDMYTEISASSAWEGESEVKVTYCDVRTPASGGGWPWGGEGNLSVDPCFATPGYWPQEPYGYSRGSQTWVDGDYHLKSEGWRWRRALSHGTHWVWDEQTSVCIDAGNPGSPLAGEVLVVPGDPENEFGRNVRINMGAYGGTPEASMAPPGWALQADLTNDGTVDLSDLEQWDTYAATPDAESPGDLDRDGDVDMADFAFFAQDMGATTPWYGTLTPLTTAVSPPSPGPRR